MSETTPAVSEAMREAVARLAFIHGEKLHPDDTLATADADWLEGRFPDDRAVAYAITDAILAGPIASEIARLTGEWDEDQADIALLKEANAAQAKQIGELLAQHVIENDRMHAAEADLTRMRAETERLAQIETPRPINEYHEDMGFVLWWILPVREPPYSGGPGCDDWPDYHTHFTPLPDIRDAAWREAYYANPEQTDA